MSKALYWKHGRIRGWRIGGAGDLLCEYDSDYKPCYRIRGRPNKLYQQVHIITCGRLQWLYVHRLMAFSWLSTPDSPLRFIVDHRNGDSLCNRVENLRWVTITANNLNKKCYGLHEENGWFSPKIGGYVHRRYRTRDVDLALSLRKLLVECYVRYNTKFPNCGSGFPHNCIYKY